MKKLFFILAIFLGSCSNGQKEVIKLSQRVSVEHVDYLGNGQYQVYFSYKWKDGHAIGTGILTSQRMGIGDIKTYVEYEKENENGQMESFRDLR